MCLKDGDCDIAKQVDTDFSGWWFFSRHKVALPVLGDIVSSGLGRAAWRLPLRQGCLFNCYE